MSQVYDPEYMSTFARTIISTKYAHTKDNGNKESWSNISYRVASCVMNDYLRDLVNPVCQSIEQRKFMPGGRYLYAAGRRYPQCNNCFLFSVGDSREEWATLMSRITNSLMTGGGIGCVYSKLRGENMLVGGMGGFSTGPCALMQMVNESARHIIQGGSRRSAVWAGLHWNHPDVFKFITLKNWREELVSLKAKDFNAAAPLDMTNISVILDDCFFIAFDDPFHPDHDLAHKVYWAVIRQACETGEPGFSVDVGIHAGEHLRNAPVVGSTYVLTNCGYQQVNDLVGIPSTIWTGQRWANDVTFTLTARDARTVIVQMTGGRSIQCEPSHEFLVEQWVGGGKTRKLTRIKRVAANELKPGDILHIALAKTAATELDTEAYTLGFVYGDGSFTNNGSAAEVTVCDSSKYPCLAVVRSSTHVSSVTECDSRGYARVYFATDHDYFEGHEKEIFPDEMYSEAPSILASFIAGLFDADGNWDASQRRIRLSSNSQGFLRGVARGLEQLGIVAGVSRNDTSTYGQKKCWQLVVMSEYMSEFARLIPVQRLKIELDGYTTYRKSTIKVTAVIAADPEDVYCCDVGVSEHSFMAEGVIISNCTEIVSADSDDVCNLASLNLARIGSKEELADLVWNGMAFMLCGSQYSVLPVKEMYHIREKNRRIGLGLMGVHEWLIMRGKKFGEDSELSEWLKVYRDVSDKAAIYWSDKMGISRPVARRAIAPTGTIAICAETTSAFESVFAIAIKRRYLTGTTWKYQYVLDACAGRLIDRGIDPESIEDAYDLSEDIGRRFAFQAYAQSYVDMGVSSTMNLPKWGSIGNNEITVKTLGSKLIPYLPKLRGITFYPDGSRGGQPLNRVSYATAIKHLGKEFEEGGVVTEEIGNTHACKDGICGV